MEKTKKERLAELKEKSNRAQTLYTQVTRANPFWFFEPNGGIPTKEGRELLEKYLKPEDLPSIFDSQEDIFKTEANIYFISGGNRSSKSVSCAIFAFIFAIRKLLTQ